MPVETDRGVTAGRQPSLENIRDAGLLVMSADGQTSAGSAGDQSVPRYTRIAALLHWLIAIFIVFNLATGWFLETIGLAGKQLLMPLHISCGMSVLGLTIVRIFWRLIHAPPPFPSDLPWTERHAAHLIHFLLYLGMVLMPLSGWAILSSHPAPGTAGAAVEAADEAARNPVPAGIKPVPRHARLKIWYVVSFPPIAPLAEIGNRPEALPAQRVLHRHLMDWHNNGALIMVLLVLLHLAGALKHQLFDGHEELQRMRLGRFAKTASVDSADS